MSIKQQRVETDSLTGRALDWGVALALGYHPTDKPDHIMASLSGVSGLRLVWVCRWPSHDDTPSRVEIAVSDRRGFTPQSDWNICGRLITKYRMTINDAQSFVTNERKIATITKSRIETVSSHGFHPDVADMETITAYADDERVAICKAVVRAMCGDSIYVPVDLIQP